MADVILRAPRAGDSEGLARCWLEVGAQYAALNPDLFQIPQVDGLAQRLEGWLLSITSEDACALVAEKDGQVVGFITAAVERPVANAAGQLLRDLRFGPGARRHPHPCRPGSAPPTGHRHAADGGG
jgi:hypothetical protein